MSIVEAEKIIAPPATGLFHLNEPVLGPDRGASEARLIEHGGMWPSQRLWWDSPEFVRLFVGGYGAGKTLMLCKRLISMALLNAPVSCAIVSPTYPMARQTIMPTMRGLLDSMQQWLKYWRRQGSGKASLTYTYKQSAPYEFFITYRQEGCKPKKAHILVYSGEHPQRLKGPNLACVGIDEPFIQVFEVFEQMSIRCRHPKAKRREVNLTGTPEQLNWGYDLAEGDLSEKYDVGIVQASTLENKALPADYVQRLLGAFDEKTALAYVHGLFVNLTSGLVYYGFDRNENVVDLDMPVGAELGVGMDFNVNPMAAVVFWVIRKGKDRHIHYFDEIELPNSDTPDMCQLLVDLYGSGGPVVPHCAESNSDVEFTTRGLETIYPDANSGRSTASAGGKTDYHHIEDAGFIIDKATRNPSLRDRFNTQNALLKPKDGRVRMTFAPRCRKLIKYNMLYSHALKNTDAQKAMGHLLDARDYPAYRLFPSNRSGLKTRTIVGV